MTSLWTILLLSEVFGTSKVTMSSKRKLSELLISSFDSNTNYLEMMFQQSYPDIQRKLMKHLLTYGPSISSSLLSTASNEALHRSISSISIGDSPSRREGVQVHDLDSVSTVSEDLSHEEFEADRHHNQPLPLPPQQKQQQQQQHFHQSHASTVQSQSSQSLPSPIAVVPSPVTHRPPQAPSDQNSPAQQHITQSHSNSITNQSRAQKTESPPVIARSSSPHSRPQTSLRLRTPSPGSGYDRAAAEEKKTPKLCTEDLLLR